MNCCKNTNSLGRLIYFTAQDLKNLAERILTPFDFTIEQFHLLKHMSTATGLSQRDLGAIANKTAGNMTRILDRLESKALVQRRANPLDRRASLVFLTPKGQTQVDQVQEVFASFSGQLLQGISKEEEELVRDTLRKLQDNLHQMSDKL